MNILITFMLARLKLIMAGVAMAATGALLTGIEQQFGFPIPAELKATVSIFVGGLFGNFTDNVKLLPDGHAVAAPTLPAKPLALKAAAADEDEDLAGAPAPAGA